MREAPLKTAKGHSGLVLSFYPRLQKYTPYSLPHRGRMQALPRHCVLFLRKPLLCRRCLYKQYLYKIVHQFFCNEGMCYREVYWYQPADRAGLLPFPLQADAFRFLLDLQKYMHDAVAFQEYRGQ